MTKELEYLYHMVKPTKGVTLEEWPWGWATKEEIQEWREKGYCRLREVEFDGKDGWYNALH
jgi:hypothetical protein